VVDSLNALERLDVLVPRPDGGWGAVEVKLDGEELIEQGAASLPAAVSSIDLQRAGEPAFMAVATATGRYAYRRDDGVCGPATSGIPRTGSQRDVRPPLVVWLGERGPDRRRRGSPGPAAMGPAS
jgi:hypothetical protein